MRGSAREYVGVRGSTVEELGVSWSTLEYVEYLECCGLTESTLYYEEYVEYVEYRGVPWSAEITEDHVEYYRLLWSAVEYTESCGVHGECAVSLSK